MEATSRICWRDSTAQGPAITAIREPPIFTGPTGIEVSSFLNSRTFPNLKEEQFYNPQINAEHGLAHFRYCIEVGKNEVVALAMYNAGINGVRRGTPYSTLHYVAKILNNKSKLVESFEQMLADKGEIAEVLVNPPS